MVFVTCLMALVFRNYMTFNCKCSLQLKLNRKLRFFFPKFLLVIMVHFAQPLNGLVYK
jgi:hypothetical protein